MPRIRLAHDIFEHWGAAPIDAAAPIGAVLAFWRSARANRCCFGIAAESNITDIEARMRSEMCQTQKCSFMAVLIDGVLQLATHIVVRCTFHRCSTQDIRHCMLCEKMDGAHVQKCSQKGSEATRAPTQAGRRWQTSRPAREDLSGTTTNFHPQTMPTPAIEHRLVGGA